jgi:hypothetical protein
MVEWISIDQWSQCESLERPGIVFEIRNAHGQSLVAVCTRELPHMPFDWTAPFLEFRPVPEPPARHSSPLPKPEKMP